MPRMKFSLATVLTLFCAALCAQDAPMKYGKVPKEDLDMKVYPLDSSAAAVVLCDYGKLTFEFPEESTHTFFTRHRRIKILKRSGFDYGDVVIQFLSSKKLRSLEAQVVAPDGTETKVPKKDIFEEKVNDVVSRIRFAFPNLREGCVVEYKYEIESEHIFQLPEWYFQQEIPVRWSELRMEIPVWYVYVSIHQGLPLDISKTEILKKNVTGTQQSGGFLSGVIDHNYIQLAVKDVPALKEETYITTMDDYYARIRFQLSATNYPSEGYKSMMGSWEKTATELFNHEDFGKQINKKGTHKKAWEAAQKHLAAAATSEEKIQALYDFVQSSFEREDGYGFLTSQDLDDLFEKKRARSFEMNLLLVALLREAGIQAHPVLLSTRDHGRPTPLYPILEQFNHVLVLAETEGKQQLLDAGNPFRPPGMVAINSLNQTGWVVDPAKPRWMDIVPAQATSVFFGIFQLNADGNLTGNMQVQQEGYDAMAQRDRCSQKPVAELWKAELQKRYPDASVDSMKVEDEKEIAKPFRESFKCSLPGYAQVSGDFIYLNPVFFTEFGENPFKLERRNYPVDMPYPFKERIVFDLDIPEGYDVESLPESTRLLLPNNGGRFQYIVEQKERQINFRCSLNVTQLHFEPEEYDVLRTFFGMAAEKMGEQVVLKKKK